MNLELYIENLGAIEKAEMTVNPLTVLAGENGTGKSFVTKFLYSVLKVLNQDVYRIYFFDKLEKLESYIRQIEKFNVEIPETNEILFLLKDMKIFTNIDYLHSFNNTVELLKNKKEIYLKRLEKAERSEKVDKKIFDFFANIFQVNPITIFENIGNTIEEIWQFFNNSKQANLKILESFLLNELKLNFQISTIEQLIRHNKRRTIFEVKGLIKLEIKDKSIKITNNSLNSSDVLNLNWLVFFESSVYWRLSNEVLGDVQQDANYSALNTIKDERLTGIPQHFIDLRDLVFTNFKHGERPAFIEECAEELQASLNGKFNSNGNDLAFETNQGQAISKNLVSFGMTNLGVLQAVLSKNIINKGSFVFIDEPESNLHPEWQAILAKILVKLAENGVFVVITTHSSDMLKALDVYTTQQQQENFISTNYFEKNGNLAFFSDDEIQNVGKLALVRNKLLEPYASLTFAKKGGFFDD